MLASVEIDRGLGATTSVIYLQKQTVTHSHLITNECPHLGNSGRVDNDIARISLWEWPK